MGAVIMCGRTVIAWAGTAVAGAGTWYPWDVPVLVQPRLHPIQCPIHPVRILAQVKLPDCARQRREGTACKGALVIN